MEKRPSPLLSGANAETAKSEQEHPRGYSDCCLPPEAVTILKTQTNNAVQKDSPSNRHTHTRENVQDGMDFCKSMRCNSGEKNTADL
jgi:hypothetical protein